MNKTYSLFILIDRIVSSHLIIRIDLNIQRSFDLFTTQLCFALLISKHMEVIT